MKYIIVILLMFCFKLSAPPAGVVLLRPKPFVLNDPLLDAFMFVESTYRVSIVNDLGYTGILQIGRDMISEANRINELSGNPGRFRFPESALDSLESVKVWYTVQCFHNPRYTLRRAVKIWNPLASVNYFNKIQYELSR